MTESWSRPVLSVILIFTVILYSCAKIGAPPGGPVDDEGPKILATIPPSDSVNVKPDKIISITFDEKVNSKTIEGALFISPRPTGEIKYKLKGQTLNILLPDSFETNTTYIVNLGTQIKDLRGNSLENSYNIAFSTGDKIAEGNLSGIIYNNEKPANGVSIGLYEIVDSIPPAIDSVYPPYLTQSGSKGEYVLNYIPEGSYFVLAFIDKNKDQMFNYPKEMFGIPDRVISISERMRTGEVNFKLTSADSAPGFGILSVVSTNDNLIKIRFTDKLKGELVAENIDKFTVVSTTDSGQRFGATSVKEADVRESTTFNLYFRNIPEDDYFIELNNRFLAPSDSANVTSQPFSFSHAEDSKPPVIEKVSHDNVQIFPRDSVIKFHFSEPMELSVPVAQGIRLSDTSGNIIDYSHDWRDYFGLNLIVNGLEWGESYQIDMDQRVFVDLSGNRLGDTLKTYKFSTFSLDSLGEFSGTVLIDTTEIEFGIPFLELLDLQGRVVEAMPAATNEFRFSAAPGKYFLRGFLDQNENGEYDPGSYRPFNYSESFTIYPDTIRVRYRFETSGIELVFD